MLRIKTWVLKEMVKLLELPYCRMAERFAWPFFQPTVVEEDGEKRYLGEDYSFCWRCHQIGIKPMVDTSFRLYHIGDYAYGIEEASGPQYLDRGRNIEYHVRAGTPPRIPGRSEPPAGVTADGRKQLDPRGQRWAPYVRQLADILRLQGLADRGLGRRAAATRRPRVVLPGRAAGSTRCIRLAESFLIDDRRPSSGTRSHTSCCTVTSGPMSRMIEAHDEAMPPAAKLAMEYCVDGLADAVAPLLPLPPASTKSQH